MCSSDLAQIASFIEASPDGYDSFVGERGIRLSGGQRQRLGIARALYKQAQVLILDEATSSIDSQAEEWIQRATIGLTTGRTSLVVAHRLATVLHADQILVLDKGCIVEQGRHEELLEKNGVYANLYEKQFFGEEA